MALTEWTCKRLCKINLTRCVCFKTYIYARQLYTGKLTDHEILLQFYNFLHFFSFFEEKNVENEDFDQHLECAAPKRCSKYTTHDESNNMAYA